MPKDNKSKSSLQQCEQSQWVMMAPDDALLQSGNVENIPVFCKLRHPRTEQACMFMFTHADSRVHEVQTFQEDFRSWFIDQTVHQDGRLMMCSAVDPLFLVLPYLIKAEKGGKFCTLDQTVEDDEFPECRRLCECAGLDELHNVTETRGSDDVKAYRYSKEKTLSWLKLKVEQVADKLSEKDINVTGGAQVATFIKSTKSDSAKPEDYTRYAHGLVSEYLPTDLADCLREDLGIKAVVHEKPGVVEPPSKKAKLENQDITPTEDYSQTNKVVDNNNKKKLSVAQKKLNQVDKKGMKSISSFFGAKNKK